MIKDYLFIVFLNSLLILESESQFFSGFGHAGSCGLLSPPSRAVMTGCTKGARDGSICSLRCANGFGLQQTLRRCICSGFFCSWNGRNPTCRAESCQAPDNNNGRITIVDKWSHGFAGVIEFERIPNQLRRGWSIVIAFNKPLGSAAKLSSWSSETTAASQNRSTFTLSNILRQQRQLNGPLPTLRTLFVATGVSSEIPTQGFAGLYYRRKGDTTCYRPRSLRRMIEMNSAELQRSVTAVRPSRISIQPIIATTTTERPTPATTSRETQPSTTQQSDRNLSGLSDSDAASRKLSISSPASLHRETTMAAAPQITTTTTKITTLRATTTTTTTVSSSTGTTTTANPLLQREVIDGMRCLYQRGKNSYRTQKGWMDSGTSYFSGNAVAFVPGAVTNWMVVIVFQKPVASMQVWNTVSRGSEMNGTLWKLGPHTFNLQHHGGQLDVNFIAELKTPSSNNPQGQVYFCSLAYAVGDPIRLYDENGNIAEAPPSRHSYAVLSTTVSTTTASTVPRPTTTYRPDTSTRCMGSSAMGTRPRKPAQSRPRWRRNRDGTKYNYNEVLAKSIFFYEAQRSGYLPPKFKKIPWRGNSMLKDGCSVGVDLSRGWFDAGDYCKFTFPMASAVTTLAWGGIEFRSAYREAGILLRFLGSVRWPVEWLIKAHINTHELVALIGNVRADHSSWSRPEDWTQARPVYTITAERPGSELAAETAAALASSSILMKRSHAALARRALDHARTLYDFANTYKGHYHKSVPEVSEFYKSHSGYTDELIWAAAWLYKASGNQSFLTDAERMYRQVGGPFLTEQEYSWDQKIIGAQVLLANLTGQDIYRSGVIRFMDAMLRATKKTPQGMLWIRTHGPNRYAANAAMIGLLACKLEPPLPGRERYFAWARQQIHLLLGDAGRSYVVGFGRNYPKRPHHRSSSCPAPPAPCDWGSYRNPNPNTYILFGALVGGPDLKGNYLDARDNYQQSEVAIDYNAGFQSAVAGLKFFVGKNLTISS